MACISLTYLVENFLRSAAGALTPVLIEELSISHAAMGTLISAYFFVYGVLQVPSGVLSDTLGARKTILSFTVLTLAGVFLFWASSSYPLLFAAQILIGVGCSTFYINAVKLISTWFPAERRATAIGVLSAASGLGNTISYLGFPLALDFLGGWRPLYLAMSLALVGSWLANALVLRDREEPQVSTHQNLASNLAATARDRRLWPFLTGYVLSSLSWVFMNWMAKYLIDAKGFTYLEVGWVVSAGTLAGIPGCIAVAAISDKLRRRKAPLIGFNILFALTLFALVYLPASLGPGVFTALSFLMGLAGSFWVLYFSMIPETLPPVKASVGLGLVNGVGTVGFSLVTPIYGLLVDLTGGYLWSNLLVQLSTLLNPLIFHLYLEESYGQTPEE